MPILHPLVARAKFPKLVDELRRDHRDAYSWTIVDATYPTIIIHVKNVRGQIAAGIVIDAESWNHRPLGVTLADPNFRRYAQYHEIPQRPDKNKEMHIYANLNTGRLWFCIQGTDEFHANYASLISWESIRHLESSRPVRVIEECLRLVDLTKLEVLGDEPAPQPRATLQPPVAPVVLPEQPRRGFRQSRQR